MLLRLSTGDLRSYLLAGTVGLGGVCGVAQTPPPNLQQYMGAYVTTRQPDNPAGIAIEGGRLVMEHEGSPAQRLRPDSGSNGAADRFAVEGMPWHLLFTRDADGAISGFRITADSDGHTLLDESRTSATVPAILPYREYKSRDVMIPMRDGVQLHAVILVPADFDPGKDAALPILMQRTPYGVDGLDGRYINQSKPELASSGYVWVFEDIRGRYKSQGTFVMNRPIVAHAGPRAIDETTDTHDTIDWLLKNVPGNNGRVGVYGVSYPGFLAMMAGIDPDPAVKAISPQAPMTDVWMGDDFFHNGAFRETYAFDYVQQMEAQNTDVQVQSREDTYDFFLREGSFARAAAAANMANLPTARAFLTQPAYTKFWRDMAVQNHLDRVSVPTLEVGGYWDQEDMWGTQEEYAALKAHDDAHEVFLVLGPWNHGGWEDPARTLGALKFGQATGTEYRKDFEAPFFEHYLKDGPQIAGHSFDLADAASFRTGENAWHRYAAWPPVEGYAAWSLYLQPKEMLSFAVPTGADGTVAGSYVSDPADPIPYRHRPIQSTYGQGSNWYNWMVEDQKFVSGRHDLANFETAALDRDVTVTGDVAADLFAATTGSDTDLVVKLIDVYPDDAAAPMGGYQLMVAGEIFRGRYLHSFEQPEALTPGAIDEFRWSLHGVDHTFLKGHRMMVEVQSTWFPLYDRNPQTFVPNIMDAPPDAYKPETITIYSSPKYPSRVDVQVLEQPPAAR